MQAWFEELRRRNVFRAAALYAVIGWIVLQIADALESALVLPDWFDSVVFAFVVLGFPLVMLLAWAFELTPERLKRTDDVDGAPAARGWRPLDIAIVAGLGLVVVMIVADRLTPSLTSEAVVEAPTSAALEVGAVYDSIAVLPFADLSAGGDQEYFADGIAEELLNVLARQRGLQVAARTSSFAFKNVDADIATIAAALSVDTVLEGSVRTSGDQLRITAQLIDASSGFHLWSDTYDRQAADIFAIQDEIAGAIVAALQVHFGSEAPQVARAINPEAYDLYLRGRHHIERRSRASLEEARRLFEAAVAADPDFAPAWSGLADAVMLLRDSFDSYGDLTLAEVQATAGPAIERALELDPNLAEAHASLGLLRGAGGDSAGAIEALRRAVDLNPNASGSRHWLYLRLLADGQYREAFEEIDHAAALDPLSGIILVNLTDSLAARGRFDEALAVARRNVSLNPELAISHTKLSHALAAAGQYAEGAALVAQLIDESDRAWGPILIAPYRFIGLELFDRAWEVSDDWNSRSFIHILQGREDEAVALVRERNAANPDDWPSLPRIAWTYWAAGDVEMAHDLFEQYAAAAGDSMFSSLGGCRPAIDIAAVRQLTGDASGAQTLIDRCQASLDANEDAGVVLFDLFRDAPAQFMMIEGRPDDAIAYLRRITDEGNYIGWWIEREPIFEPIWGDPRFQAVVADLHARAASERARFEELTAEAD